MSRMMLALALSFSLSRFRSLSDYIRKKRPISHISACGL